MVNLSRRSFLEASGVALAGLGLAACGGSSDSDAGTDAGAGDSSATTDAAAASVEPQNGTPATTPLDQLPIPEKGKTYNNPQDRDNVQDGGTLVLPAGEVGPNWNYLSVEGNTVEMMTYWTYYMPQDLFISDPTAGTYTPNPDFISDFKSEQNGDVQTLTYTINPDAHFNDGTPIDYRAFQAIWSCLNGENEAYTPAATDGWDSIASVERGDDDKQVVVTMKTPIYPAEMVFTQVMHPDSADPDVFNNGWNINPHPEWGYGPYTIDSVDESQVTFVPNPEWWGEAPKLESIQYKQMESQALYNAFRNGEVDATGESASGSQEMLSNFSSMDDAEVRRAFGIACYCMEMNTTRDNVKDPVVREAIAMCMDPATLVSVVFQGVNWSEEAPGSLLLPTWMDGYENNMPEEYQALKTADDHAAGAKKVLEDAGYALDDDGYYAKDGAEVTWSVTTFGDSNTTKNRAAAIQQMAKNAGMKVEIDNRPSSEFSETLTSGDYDTTLFGWSGTPTNTWFGKQIYGLGSLSNFTQTGDEAVDEKFDSVKSIEDAKERMKVFNEAEKEALKTWAFVPLHAGPDCTVTKAGLANFGPALFETVPTENIGWQKA